MRKIIFLLVVLAVTSIFATQVFAQESTQPKAKESTQPKAEQPADGEEENLCKGKNIELPENASSVAVDATQKEGCVISGGLGVALPAPDGGAAISALQEDGTPADLLVTRSADGGTLTVEEEPTPEPPAEAVVPACDDNRFALRGTKIENTITWRYNGSTDEANAHGAAVQDATDNIENVFNPCGQPDNVPNIFERGSGTSEKANVFVDQTTGALVCEPSDGQSVVSWGAIRTGTIAAECSYTLGLTSDGYRNTVETDIEGNKSTYNFTTSPNQNPGKYDVESIMTHERGHSAGLDHAGDAATSQLTMVPNASRGTSWMRSLGLGDAVALNTLYP